MPPKKGSQHPESQVTNSDGLCSEDEQENNAIEPTKSGPHRKTFAEHAKSAEPDSFPCKAEPTRRLMERILPTVQQMTDTLRRALDRLELEEETGKEWEVLKDH
ncbi:hypothetical protein DL768_004973 [Monosporascus sp. mg162]|nr:hypothetical protein DL768_004973 [Monosporascus sp. mg162]